MRDVFDPLPIRRPQIFRFQQILVYAHRVGIRIVIIERLGFHQRLK